MATVVTLNTVVDHRYIFELRYDFGHVYWDRCGRVINEIIEANEKWNFEKMDAGFCHLRSSEQNLDFHYGWAKLDLTQSQDREITSLLPIGEFGALAESLATPVVGILQLAAFTRIGFRHHYLYPTSNIEEAYERLRSLRLFPIDAGIARKIGTLSEVSFRAVVQRPQHRVRIAIAPFEQQVNLSPAVVKAAKAKAREHWKDQRDVIKAKLRAQHMIEQLPRFGILVDLDASIDEPPFPDALSVSDFINHAEADFRSLIPTLLEAGN